MAKFTKEVTIVIAAALVSTFAGCYGRGTDEASTYPVVDPNAPATFATVNAEIFQPLCSECHSAWFSSEKTLLSHADLIVPGRPDNSEILQMVESGKMPKGGAKLSDGQIDLIRRYITQVEATSPTPAPSPSPNPSPSPKPPSNPEATYSWLSTNLFQVSCMKCHNTANQKGGVILDTYEGAKASGTDALSEIQTGDMPPDDAGKPPVTPEAEAALSEWTQIGYPE